MSTINYRIRTSFTTKELRSYRRVWIFQKSSYDDSYQSAIYFVSQILPNYGFNDYLLKISIDDFSVLYISKRDWLRFVFDAALNPLLSPEKY